MNDIQFRHRVLNGSILRFHVLPCQLGTTSVRYGVDVYADVPGSVGENCVLFTVVTFVGVDRQGKKQALPRVERFASQG